MRVPNNTDVGMYGFATRGSATLRLVSGIVHARVGRSVIGQGVPDGSRIIGIDRDAKTLELSASMELDGKIRFWVRQPEAILVGDVAVVAPMELYAAGAFHGHDHVLMTRYDGSKLGYLHGDVLRFVMSLGQTPSSVDFFETDEAVCASISLEDGHKLVEMYRAGGYRTVQTPAKIHGGRHGMYCLLNGQPHRLDDVTRQPVPLGLGMCSGIAVYDATLFVWTDTELRSYSLPQLELAYDICTDSPIERLSSVHDTIVCQTGTRPLRLKALYQDGSEFSSPSVSFALGIAVVALCAYDGKALLLAVGDSLQALRLDHKTKAVDLIRFLPFESDRLTGVACDDVHLYVSDIVAGKVKVYQKP